MIVCGVPEAPRPPQRPRPEPAAQQDWAWHAMGVWTTEPWSRFPSSQRPASSLMAIADDDHRDAALVCLGDRQPMDLTWACRREIRSANLRLWRCGLPWRYGPWHQA
jgi:hypothetical protein